MHQRQLPALPETADLFRAPHETGNLYTKERSSALISAMYAPSPIHHIGTGFVQGHTSRVLRDKHPCLREMIVPGPKDGRPSRIRAYLDRQQARGATAVVAYAYRTHHRRVFCMLGRSVTHLLAS